MNRLYKALAWLAGLALIAGLVKAILLWTPAINALSQSYGLQQPDGLFSLFLTVLNGARVDVFMSATNLLIGGVTVMTLIVAGVDRRRGWLIALTIVTIVAVFWPLGIADRTVRWLPLSSLRPPVVVMDDMLFAIPLIPMVMALIFALTRRDAAAPSAQGVAIQPQ